MKSKLVLGILLSYLSFSCAVDMVFQEAFLLKQGKKGTIKLIESSDEGVYVAGEYESGLFFGKVDDKKMDWIVEINPKEAKKDKGDSLLLKSLSVYDRSLVAIGSYERNISFSADGGFNGFDMLFENGLANYFIVGVSDQEGISTFYNQRLTISGLDDRAISSSIDKDKSIYVSTSFDGHLYLGNEDIDGNEEPVEKVSFLISIPQIGKPTFSVLGEHESQKCPETSCQIDKTVYVFPETNDGDTVKSKNNDTILAQCDSGEFKIEGNSCVEPFCEEQSCETSDGVSIFPQLNYGKFFDDEVNLAECVAGVLMINGKACTPPRCLKAICIIDDKEFTFNTTDHLEIIESKEEEKQIAICKYGNFIIEDESCFKKTCEPISCIIDEAVYDFPEIPYYQSIKVDYEKAECNDGKVTIDGEKCVQPTCPKTTCDFESNVLTFEETPFGQKTKPNEEVEGECRHGIFYLVVGGNETPCESLDCEPKQCGNFTFGRILHNQIGNSTETPVKEAKCDRGVLYELKPNVDPEKISECTTTMTASKRYEEPSYYEPSQMKILEDTQKLFICSDSKTDSKTDSNNIFKIDLFPNKKSPEINILTVETKSHVRASIFPTEKHVYFAGVFDQDITIKEKELKIGDESLAIFYGKVDHEGKVKWVGKISGIGKYESTPYVPIAVTCESTCQLFIGGPSTKETALGGTKIKVWPSNLGFISCIDDEGEPIWIEEVFQNAKHGVVEDLAVHQKRVYVGGTIQGEKIKFNWISVEDAPESTPFIAVIGAKVETKPTDIKPTDDYDIGQEDSSLLPLSLAVGFTVLCVAFTCWRLSKRRGKSFRKRKDGYNRVEAYEMDARDDVTIFAVDERK